VALFITTCVFGSMHWQSLAVQFKRFGFSHWAAWAGLGALVPLIAINWGYHGLLKALGAGSAFTTDDMLNTLGWGGVTFLICVCPGVMEEIAFRGLVQHWLQVALRPWRAILLASVLFTILHFTILSAPYLLLVGLLLGWTKWKTGSLYPSMLIHMLHNFAALALLR
jgi:membrane protease YdiL (CAAX protease family)